MLCCMDWWKKSDSLLQSKVICYPASVESRSHLWAPTWIDPSFQMYLALLILMMFFFKGKGLCFSWAQALLSLILALWTINQFMDAPGAVPSDGNSSTLREALQLLCLLNLNARNSLCIFGIFLLFSAAYQSRAEFIMMFFFLYVGIWEWQGLLTKGNARGHAKPCLRQMFGMASALHFNADSFCGTNSTSLYICLKILDPHVGIRSRQVRQAFLLWVQVKPYLSGFTWLMGVGSLQLEGCKVVPHS